MVLSTVREHGAGKVRPMIDQFALMRAVPVVGFLAVLVLACMLALWIDDPHLSRSTTGRR
eukprot:COSAG01_NODE_29004_length_647_cov_3.483577_1_plen_59_part_01